MPVLSTAKLLEHVLKEQLAICVDFRVSMLRVRSNIEHGRFEREPMYFGSPFTNVNITCLDPLNNVKDNSICEKD